MTRRVTLSRWDDIPLEKVSEMVARKVVSGRDAALAQAYYKKGAIVPVHAHDADVIVYVLQGALRVAVEGEDVTAREGDVLVIPAAASHQAESLDDTFVLTVTRPRD